MTHHVLAIHIDHDRGGLVDNVVLIGPFRTSAEANEYAARSEWHCGWGTLSTVTWLLDLDNALSAADAWAEQLEYEQEIAE